MIINWSETSGPVGNACVALPWRCGQRYVTWSVPRAGGEHVVSSVLKYRQYGSATGGGVRRRDSVVSSHVWNGTWKVKVSEVCQMRGRCLAALTSAISVGRTVSIFVETLRTRNNFNSPPDRCTLRPPPLSTANCDRRRTIASPACLDSSRVVPPRLVS